MKICEVPFANIVSIENLLSAWQGFVRGKSHRQDVLEFEAHLMDHLFALHDDLVSGSYHHGGYHEFRVNDPKPRLIHKATVRDRVVHHAVFAALYPFYDKTFIADSYASRLDKGVHKAVNRLRMFSGKVTRNYHQTAWVLQCDVRKFFASIDHAILMTLLEERIRDERVVALLTNIIESFSLQQNKGIPLGNLTSQLFANVYLHELDQFVKQTLRVPFYIRYADDFVLLAEDRGLLEQHFSTVESFLKQHLHLFLHPDKVSIRTVGSGHDFLGWIQFPHHRLPRKRLVRRARTTVYESGNPRILASYLGLLSHGDTHELSRELLNLYRFSGNNMHQEIYV